MTQQQRTGAGEHRAGYDADAFSEALGAVSGWADRYLRSLETRDVREAIEPGQIMAMLPGDPPQTGMGRGGWDEITKDLETIVEPGLVHWQSGRFFAYFPCSASMPGVMGELVSAVMNVNGMLWSTSPSVTELEMRMLDWCASMFGLPQAFRFDGSGSDSGSGSGSDSGGGGCIQGTASEGALAALVAARKKKVAAGHDRTTMTVYASTQAHSSIVKAAMVAGLADGPDDFSRVRLIEPGASLGMDLAALERAIGHDVSAGLTPCMVVSTQGTTSTGARDPLDGIGAMLGEMDPGLRPWLHVDAAWAGAAAVCPEHRGMLAGIEHADSLCINPHKWLLTNFDCDLFWVRDRAALTGAMSITPEYLRNEQSETGAVVDYRDWHVPLGRRMRALKLWFVIRYFGVQGLEAHIRSHIALAARFEAFVRSEARLTMAVERSLSLVCFCAVGGDAPTAALIERVNARRRVLISHSRVPLGPKASGAGDRGAGGPEKADRLVARVAIGSSGVTGDDVDVLIGEIVAALDQGVE